jgi:hypothetical protein
MHGYSRKSFTMLLRAMISLFIGTGTGTIICKTCHIHLRIFLYQIAKFTNIHTVHETSTRQNFKCITIKFNNWMFGIILMLP